MATVLTAQLLTVGVADAAWSLQQKTSASEGLVVFSFSWSVALQSYRNFVMSLPPWPNVRLSNIKNEPYLFFICILIILCITRNYVLCPDIEDCSDLSWLWSIQSVTWVHYTMAMHYFVIVKIDGSVFQGTRPLENFLDRLCKNLNMTVPGSAHKVEAVTVNNKRKLPKKVECELCGLTLRDKFVKRRHVSTLLILDPV